METAIDLLNERAKVYGYSCFGNYLIDRNIYSIELFVTGVIDSLIKERDELIELKNKLNKHNDQLLTDLLNHKSLSEELKEQRDGFSEQYNMAIERNSELQKIARDEAYKLHNKSIEVLSLEEIIKDWVNKEHYPRWVDVNENFYKNFAPLHYLKNNKKLYVEDNKGNRFILSNGKNGEWLFNGRPLVGITIKKWLEEEPQQKQMTNEEKDYAIRQDAENKLIFGKSISVSEGKIPNTTIKEEIEKVKSKIQEIESLLRDRN